MTPYPLAFTVCAMRDVIKRSAVCHPSEFVKALIEARKPHLEHALTTKRDDTARIALAIAWDLTRIADSVNKKNLNVDELSVMHVILAFDVASRLQGLRWDVSHDIAARDGVEV